MAVEAAGYAPVRVVPWENRGSKDLYDAISECAILVQTTRVGMHPHSAEMPEISVEALTPQHIVYDLVYNPVETALLREARKE